LMLISLAAVYVFNVQVELTSIWIQCKNIIVSSVHVLVCREKRRAELVRRNC
jgi:hypothetical protein